MDVKYAFNDMMKNLNIAFFILTILYSPIVFSMSFNDETQAIESAAKRLLMIGNIPLANKLFKEAARRHLWAIAAGDRFIFINLNDQHIRVMVNNELVIHEKIIIGKTDTPTPEFTSTLTSIVINPVWNIPNSIADGFVTRMELTGIWPGYSIYVNDAKIENIDDISSKYKMKQEPGSRNALGKFKFNAPNKYGVFIHDTPKKQLFDKENRIFSAGCVRMQNPDKLAKLLIGKTKEHRLNHEIVLKQPINIHIVKWDIFVDYNGQLILKVSGHGPIT